MAEKSGGFDVTSGIYRSPDKPGGPTTPSPEENHEKENEAESQKYSRRESLSEALIGAAETPEELFVGLRQLEKQLEDGNIPQGLTERYTPPRELATMYERADMMAHTIEELLERGWITNYDPSTGKGKVKDRRFDALAVKVEQVERLDERGRYTGVDIKYNFGTTESRKNLEEAYREAILELEARDIMGEHISVRLNLDFRDNLEELTGVMHGGRMPKFKADHLQALFNMPGVTELKTNLENHQLGDQVEEAMFLNLVMLNSGTKQKMLDFLERPGAKHLIAKIAKEWGVSYDQWVAENIGDIDKWIDDEARTLTSYITEPRGTVTKWSNIASFEGKDPSDNFSADKEREFIEDIVGGLVGNAEASWVAATMMRVIGAYASEGYVALPPGQKLNTKTGKMEDILLKDKISIRLGEGRYISSDDTGKFLAYMFDLKEGLKGRSSGLKDMIGRIPDMAMNLFDWAQITVELPNGEKVKRSIWDAWLGTAGGKAKRDLLTEQETDQVTKEEPYHRLGGLNFKSLDRDFHGTFTIMQWLMGRSERDGGLYSDARKTEFRFDEDFALNNLKKKTKYLQICFNPIVLTKGSAHLYTYPQDDEGKESINKAAETIQRNFFRNLNSARIHSASFNLNILGAPARLFNPGMGPTQISVPQVKLIEMFVNEALKDSPKDEEELIKHYIDNNSDLRSLAGTSKAVDEAVANAKFDNNVGRVTGKNF